VERVIGFEPTTSCLAIARLAISTISLGSTVYASNSLSPCGFRASGREPRLLLTNTEIDRGYPQNHPQHRM
jgi:hypothetical protein